MEEIYLHIDGQVFPVKKDILCYHSDYFRTMFSGNFIEKHKRDITVGVIDAISMNILLKYMDLGSIDIFEYTVPVIWSLMEAVNYLQIAELKKQIEYCLSQLTASNCMKIMAIAERGLAAKLEHQSAAFSLLSFKCMKPEYIPTIDRLFWYLSHPYLDTDNEIEVFKFGFDWISQTEIGGDALLIILGCLDVKRLTLDDLKQILLIIKHYENSLSEKVINCLECLHNSENISLETVTKKRSILCEMFTERVYTETYNIVKESKERKLKYTPAVPMIDISNSGTSSTHLFTFTEDKGLEKWLQVSDEDFWDWNVASWGNTKLVVVCGQHWVDEEDTVSFMNDVMIYNTLEKEWTNHGVELPPRRQGGVAVLGDLLYIIGGAGLSTGRSFSPILDTAIVYNLKERTYREITKFPEHVLNPAVCSHKGSIYAVGSYNVVYVYKDDCWTSILTVKSNADFNCLISFNDYIYFLPLGCDWTKSNLQRFRPEIEDSWELIKKNYQLDGRPHAICNMKSHGSRVEEFWEKTLGKSVAWSTEDSQYKFDRGCGTCTVVVDMPSSLRMETSTYHQKYLSSYSNVYMNKVRS